MENEGLHNFTFPFVEYEGIKFSKVNIIER